MTGEQIERVAKALAQATSELNSAMPVPAVTERHRQLARVAIKTLERLRLETKLQEPATPDKSIGTARTTGIIED